MGLSVDTGSPFFVGFNWRFDKKTICFYPFYGHFITFARISTSH